MPSAPVRPEALLEHAVWLRGLATSLVRGDADADDLVQETWLASLRRPPLDDRPVRGWLTEVVRNAGRMRGRSAGRRAVREAAAGAVAETSAPSAEDLLGRLEAQRLLARLVAELPEPLRAAMLLRYFEGLSAAEIARHQGVPAGTVRWRLKTGLDRLRAALDRENDGDRGRWTALLGPLSLSAHRGLPVASVLKGVWVMSRIAKIGAVVAALVMLAGAGAWWRARRAQAVGPAPAAARVEAKHGARRSSSSAPPRAAPLTMTAATVERDPSAVHGAFEGRVIDWASGAGVGGAEVMFSVEGETSPVRADADGGFRFAPPREGRCGIALVTAAGYLPFAPEWGHSSFDLFARSGTRVRDLTVYLTPALDYTGVVLDPDEHPVAGASVVLLGAGQGELALHPIADHFTADDRGEFVFHAPDGALLEARHPAFAAGRGRLDGIVATSHRLTIHLRARGAAELGAETIAGRVIDGSGAPVAGALVRATPRDGDPDALHPTAQALSDAAGRFTLEGLDPGPHAVVASHAGHASAVAQGVPAGATDVVLDLHAGGALTGRVTAADGGAPVPSFTIAVTRRDGPVKEVSVAVRSVVDPDGRFTVADLEPGDYRVRASAMTQAPSRPVDATVPDPPATAAPLEIALTRGGKLVGKVVDADGGGPLAHARVSMESALDASSTVPIVATALSSDTGDFALEGVPAGVRSVTVAAYQHNIRILSGMHFDEGATVGPITVALAATEEGEEPHIEVAGIGAALRAEGDGLEVQKLFPGGGAIEAGLAPGDVILAIDGAPVTSLGFDESIQIIRGPEGSSVVLTVRKANGAVVDVATPRHLIHT